MSAPIMPVEFVSVSCVLVERGPAEAILQTLSAFPELLGRALFVSISESVLTSPVIFLEECCGISREICTEDPGPEFETCIADGATVLTSFFSWEFSTISVHAIAIGAIETSVVLGAKTLGAI
jgi:hypothetical protein